jgi:hypothetical protein
LFRLLGVKEEEGAKMKKPVEKFGKYNVATFIIMGVGLVLFFYPSANLAI